MPAWIAPAIIAGVGALVDWFGAKKQSDASEQATEAQTAAGTQALALQKQIYEQQRADLAPWRTQGSQAMTTLGSLMGLPAAPTGSGRLGENATLADVAAEVNRQSSTGELPPADVSAYPSPGTLEYSMGGGQPPPGYEWKNNAWAPTASSYQDPSGTMRPYPGGPQSTYAPSPLRTGIPLVTMRAPTGETKTIPLSDAAYWKAKGATFVA